MVDPFGLYEVDVHYYLTYYLAKMTGCFTDAEAKEIAEGDQGTDEDPRTLPTRFALTRMLLTTRFTKGAISTILKAFGNKPPADTRPGRT